MKILLTGLQPDFDLANLRERMTHFGPVVDVQPVRDGDPDHPWAIVEMAIGVAEAHEIARRIDGIYYVDRFIRATVMRDD
jgi:hypothetical protein